MSVSLFDSQNPLNLEIPQSDSPNISDKNIEVADLEIAEEIDSKPPFKKITTDEQGNMNLTSEKVTLL